MYQHLILEELIEAQTILQNLINDTRQIKLIENAAKLIVNSFHNGGKVISCGNGGSHCDAMHFVEELTGKYRKTRPGYPAIVISDPSYISSISNDFGYEQVFSHYLNAIGKAGDVLVGFSTSGNSLNIIRAIETARAKNIKIVILTGKNGGKISGTADIEICIPHYRYADRIQEIHIKIIHILILLIEIEDSI